MRGLHSVRLFLILFLVRSDRLERTELLLLLEIEERPDLDLLRLPLALGLMLPFLLAGGER